MSRVTLTPKAKADLDDIWDFTFARWGMGQAEKYVRDLWAAIEKQITHLANSIDIGDVRPGYRKGLDKSPLVRPDPQTFRRNVAMQDLPRELLAGKLSR